MSSSYLMEQKTFAEASCINDTHTRKTILAAVFSDRVKKCSILWSVWVFFAFLEKTRSNRYCLWEENLIFHI